MTGRRIDRLMEIIGWIAVLVVGLYAAASWVVGCAP